MNTSKAFLMAVLCLALVSHEAQAWGWGWRRFGPWKPVTDPDFVKKCTAATDFNTKVKPCRDEVAAQFAKGTLWSGMGPACCALKLGEFDGCIRPRLPESMRNSTAYPHYLEKLCHH